MHWTLALGALVVGVVVGLTGMGGGALMTPMLVLFFGVSPLAAVSSDLVASAVMKPVGSVVHLRHGTGGWTWCVGCAWAASRRRLPVCSSRVRWATATTSTI